MLLMWPANTLFAFAMDREAKPFRRRCPNARVIVTGVGIASAKTLIARAISIHRPELIVFAGFAGALIDGLHVGQIVVAAEIITEHVGYVPAIVTNRGTIQEGGDAIQGLVFSTDRIVGNPEDKRQLAREWGVIAVDMESGAISQVCSELELPWLVVRSISDEVETGLSPDLEGLLNRGHVSIAKTLRLVLKKPSVLVEFRRLARDTRIAADRLADYLSQFVAND